jgi:hypothetical protein
MPRWPKSVPDSLKAMPAARTVHSAGSAPRLCHRLPSARSNAASARAQASSGSDGFQTAWAQGRASTILPKRSSFLPSPLSSSS